MALRNTSNAKRRQTTDPAALAELVTTHQALHFARCGGCKALVLRDVHGANFTPALGLPHACGDSDVEVAGTWTEPGRG